MSLRITIAALALLTPAAAMWAAEGCDPVTTAQIRESARVVDSLHPEKSGQARVVAADGSEFTAGQVLWMQAQVRRVTAACNRGDQQAGAQALAELRKFIKSHRRAT